MPPVFALTANDHPGTRLGGALLREAWGGAIPAGLSACAIGAAHGDDPARMRRVSRDRERALGGPCAAPFLTDPDLDRAAARAAIEGADLLYFDGGDTLAIVAAAEARGLRDAFRRAAGRARVVFGLSAGAAVASACTNAWDEAGELARIEPCLDLGVPWPVDVHDETDDWPEARTLLELLARDGRLDPAVLVIPTGGAVLIGSDGRARSRGRARAELRRLDARGAWRLEALPD